MDEVPCSSCNKVARQVVLNAVSICGIHGMSRLLVRISHHGQRRKDACWIYLKGTGRVVVAALSLIETKNETVHLPAGRTANNHYNYILVICRNRRNNVLL